ncbi:DNA modification methyltransferase [Oceanotoga phage vB_OteS-UFV02]
MRMEIIHDDCARVTERLIKEGTIVDLIVTDPPYKIATAGGGLYKQDDKRYVKNLKSMSNGFSQTILDQLVALQKGRINMYFFCSQNQILPLLKYFVDNKKCNYNILSWHKTNPVPACGNKYLTDTEYILFFRSKGVKVYGEYKTKKTYYVSPLNVKDKKKWGHSTIKPLNIVENLIINSSLIGDTVYDPFLGSGTTGVASMKLYRKFIGAEINEKYYNTAIKRIKLEGGANIE